jgi:hypothetical protein
LPQSSREIALVGEADLGSNFDERQVGIGEQGLGSLDSDLRDVLYRGKSRRSFELPMIESASSPKPRAGIASRF